MSRANGVLVIGGEPRVDLMPPEVHKERAAKVARRRLILGVVGVLVITLAGSAAATVLSLGAQIQLADEQSRTPGIMAEQAKFVDVRTVQGQVDQIKAAQQVGVSTEIDWKKYLEGVQAILPSSVTIQSVAITSASPLAIYAQPTAPLQGARVATVTFEATSQVLPDVPTWLTSLATLPGFADALPGSVVLDETTKGYKVNITMHVNDAAYAKRFAVEEK